MVDQTILKLFRKRVRKEGPMGNDLIGRLENANGETRMACSRYASNMGMPLTARKVRLWWGDEEAA